MTRNYWHSTTLSTEVARNTIINQDVDGRFQFSYRHILAKSSESDADPTMEPMAGTISNISRHEMLLIARELFFAALPDHLPKDHLTGEEHRQMSRVRSSLREMASHCLDTAEELYSVRPPWASRFMDRPFQSWSTEVVKKVTTEHMGNLHITRFLDAVVDATEAAGEYQKTMIEKANEDGEEDSK